MDKIQIECPNCGAMLQASQLAEIKCPYCGSRFSNPINEEKNTTVIRSIIPFSTSGNDFKERLFEKFIEKKQIPQDIFKHLEIQSLEQYYLPMYLFSGNYNADWSCTVVYSHTDKNGKEQKDYRPTSGVANGTFSKLTLAINGNDLPQELRNFVDVIDGTSEILSNKTKYAPSYLANEQGEAIQVSERIISKDEAWNKNSLDKSIRQDGRDAAYSQMSGWTTQDSRISVDYRGVLIDTVLFSVWYGKYTYKGQECFFVMDGRGVIFDFSHPKDNDYKYGLIKQFFIMFGALGLLTFAFGNWTHWTGYTIPTLWGVFISVVLLSTRYIIEYRKSTKDIKANKQIGKAIFCNENVPDVSSSNYVGCKRINRLLTWCCIGLISIIGVCSVVKMKNEESLSQKRGEELKQIHLKKLQQERHKEILKTINSPDLFSHTSKEQYGHLKQDLRQRLLELGFEKEESKGYDIGEKYTLQIPTEEKGRIINIKIELNQETNTYSSHLINKDDDIRDVRINAYSEDYKENFLTELMKRGFVREDKLELQFKDKKPTTIGTVYMRIGENFSKKTNILMREKIIYYADWDAVIFIGSEITLYSKNETNDFADKELETETIDIDSTALEK